MDKNYLIQLTNELYRLTLLFPKKEPLRYKMREVADDILAYLISANPDSASQMNFSSTEKDLAKVNSLENKLELLDSFFEVAKAQNWVLSLDILRLQEQYNRIKAETKKVPKNPLGQEESSNQPSSVDSLPAIISESINKVSPSLLNYRQEKILKFLKENGRTQVWQIKQIFPEVSKRTLRRDFESLLKNGKIERMGEKNNTFYQLPTSVN